MLSGSWLLAGCFIALFTPPQTGPGDSWWPEMDRWEAEHCENGFFPWIYVIEFVLKHFFGTYVLVPWFPFLRTHVDAAVIQVLFSTPLLLLAQIHSLFRSILFMGQIPSAHPV